MEITGTRKTARVIEPIEVMFAGVTDETDADLRAAAYAAAGESPERCFGSYVWRYEGGRVRVSINRD